TRTKEVEEVGWMADEGGRGSELGILEDRWDRVPKCQCGEPIAAAREKVIGDDDESAGAKLDQGRESYIDLPFGARIQNVELQPEAARRYLQLLRLRLGEFWAAWIDEQGHSDCCRDKRAQQLKPLRSYLRSQVGHAREISARRGQAGHKSQCNWV